MKEQRTRAGFLVILSPPELEAKIPFYFGKNIVGRSKQKASIHIDTSQVSQRHALIFASEQGVTLKDIGSKNGTTINDKDNRLQTEKTYPITEDMIFFFAEVKCTMEFVDALKSQKGGKALQQKGEKQKKMQEVMKMFDDQSQAVKSQKKTEIALPQTKAKPLKDEFKKINYEEFDIDEGFGLTQAEKQSNMPVKAPDNKKAKGKVHESKESLPKQEKLGKKSKKTQKEADPEAKKVEKQKNKKEVETTLGSNTNVTKNESKANPENSKPVQPSKKDKKKKVSPPKTEPEKHDINYDKKSLKKSSPPAKKVSPRKKPSPPAKKESPPAKKGANKSKEMRKSKKQLDLAQQNKVRKSDRLSADKRSNDSKMSVPSELDKKDGRKTGSKEYKTKNQIKPKAKGDKSKSLSPVKDQKIKIKIIKPPKERLLPIKQAEREIQSTKNQTKKRRVNQSEDNLLSGKYHKSRIIPSRRKGGRKILFSGVDFRFQRDLFDKVISWEQQFDFLVMQEYSRTFKALLAITLGVPIVSLDWLKNSETLGFLCNPKTFYFHKIPDIYDAIEAASSGNKIFDELEFVFGSTEYHMPKNQIEALIEAGGGMVTRKLVDPKRDRIVVLIRNKGKGKEVKEYEADRNKAKNMGYRNIYTLEFVLESCERQEIDWDSNEVQ